MLGFVQMKNGCNLCHIQNTLKDTCPMILFLFLLRQIDIRNSSDSQLVKYIQKPIPLYLLVKDIRT